MLAGTPAAAAWAAQLPQPRQRPERTTSRGLILALLRVFGAGNVVIVLAQYVGEIRLRTALQAGGSVVDVRLDGTVQARGVDSGRGCGINQVVLGANSVQ